METLKKIFFILLFVFLIFNNSYSESLKGNAVAIQILDKITSRLENIEIIVGETIRFGSLQIEIFQCIKRPPEEIPEDFVLMRINDEISSDKFERIFQGWMISSSPEVTPFEHPTYDVWIKDCKIDIDSE